MIITTTGWTFQQIEDTPWPVLLDLLDYWKENPPQHLLMKKLVGLPTGSAPRKFEPTPPDAVKAMVNAFTGGKK